MFKKQITELPIYFDRYINYVPDISVLEALATYGPSYLSAEMTHFEKLGLQVYAPEKWTIPDILQHLIDTERIFSYRALRFARKDNTSLPGFDENEFALHAHASARSCQDLLDEFAVVRASTIALYKSFTEEDMAQKGMSFKSDISVLAIGFTSVGHVMHHLGVIKDRYYPLIGA